MTGPPLRGPVSCCYAKQATQRREDITMNWYRFRIELSAWAAKTSMCVLTSVIVLRTFGPGPDGAVKHYPASWRLVAENEWIFPVGLLLLAALMWLCYWKVTRNLRADKRYGDR